MCDYCKTDELGDSDVIPLVNIDGDKLFGKTGQLVERENGERAFFTPFQIEFNIFGGALELSIGTRSCELLNVRKNINFCPICGRKLESEDNTHET